MQNFAANVALAVGASPIMANYAEEAADLAKLGGALVVNMGTVTPEGLESYKKALKAYNEADRPVVLDPVGYVHYCSVTEDLGTDYEFQGGGHSGSQRGCQGFAVLRSFHRDQG